MPVFVLKERNGMPTIELIWYEDEWCQLIPQAWREHCGCKRCCPLDVVKQFVKEKLIKHLVDGGVTTWFKNIGTNHWWFLRYYHKRGVVCLVPWPKKLVRRLTFGH